MSVHLNVYVGPYLLVPKRLAELPAKASAQQCRCKEFPAGAKFCPYCGTAVSAPQPAAQLLKRTLPHNVEGLDPDAFAVSAAETPGHGIWLPNRIGCGRHINTYTPSELPFFSLNDSLIQAELLRFKQTYEKELALLAAFLGSEPVLLFGVVREER